MDNWTIIKLELYVKPKTVLLITKEHWLKTPYEKKTSSVFFFFFFNNLGILGSLLLIPNFSKRKLIYTLRLYIIPYYNPSNVKIMKKKWQATARYLKKFSNKITVIHKIWLFLIFRLFCASHSFLSSSLSPRVETLLCLWKQNILKVSTLTFSHKSQNLLTAVRRKISQYRLQSIFYNNIWDIEMGIYVFLCLVLKTHPNF